MKKTLILLSALIVCSCSKENINLCDTLKDKAIISIKETISSGNELFVEIYRNKWIENQNLELNAVNQTLEQIESALSDINSDKDKANKCNTSEMEDISKKAQEMKVFIEKKKIIIKNKAKILEDKIKRNECSDIETCIKYINESYQDELKAIIKQ